MSRATLFSSLCAAALATLASIPLASAAPITTNPGPLNGSGLGSSAIFAYSDAADRSYTYLQGFDSNNPIFTNHNPGADAIGTTKSLGVLSGPQVFGLNNTSQGNNFLANVADGQGNFHALYSSSCTSLATCNTIFAATYNVGALGTAASTAISTFFAANPTANLIFVGWEDRTAPQGSDFDYNDLIFAFSNLNRPEGGGVPEPSTLLLVGGSLLGLGLLRRRKKARVGARTET
jgi:hypothetical protein